MGTYIHLDISWNAIPPAAWAKAYDETVHLLRADPSQLMGHARRPLLGHQVPMYTADIEQSDEGERGFCITGDRSSMRFGETFDLWRGDPDSPSARVAKRPADLVLRAPDDEQPHALSVNTHGEPYHGAIVAVGLLLEAWFPGAVLLSGDIEEGDAATARRWAGGVLGRLLPMPVLFDERALLQRLSARWSGKALLDAFARRFRGEMARGLAHAFAASGRPAAEAYLRRSLGPASRDGLRSPADLVQGFLLATADIEQLCSIADDVLPAAEMAQAIAGAGALLPAALRARALRCREVSLALRPDVSSLGSLIGARYLDKDWSGPAIDEGALERGLSRGGPRRGAELLQHVRQEAQKVEQTLIRCCDAVEAAAPFQAGLPPYQDVGDLVAVRDTSALVPYTRQRLAAFAYRLRAVPRDRRERTKRAALLRDPSAACLACVELGRNRAPTLTEHAWAWIVKEDDPAVLGLVLELWSMEGGGDEGTRLRRALLENRVLCAETVRMMGDEAALAEGKAFIDEVESERRKRRPITERLGI